MNDLTHQKTSAEVTTRESQVVEAAYGCLADHLQNGELEPMHIVHALFASGKMLAQEEFAEIALEQGSLTDLCRGVVATAMSNADYYQLGGRYPILTSGGYDLEAFADGMSFARLLKVANDTLDFGGDPLGSDIVSCLGPVLDDGLSDGRTQLGAQSAAPPGIDVNYLRTFFVEQLGDAAQVSGDEEHDLRKLVVYRLLEALLATNALCKRTDAWYGVEYKNMVAVEFEKWFASVKWEVQRPHFSLLISEVAVAIALLDHAYLCYSGEGNSEDSFIQGATNIKDILVDAQAAARAAHKTRTEPK